MQVSEIRPYLEENPIACAGSRVINVYASDGQDSMAELDEIPFFRSPFFIVLIATFTLFVRLQYLVRTATGSGTSVSSIDEDTHVFILNSSNKYRSYAFVEIGSRLQESGHDVFFVCSPDATGKADDWRGQGFEIETFRQLLRFVPVVHLPKLFVEAVRLSLGLRRQVPEEFSTAPRSLVLNMIFLELLKQESLRPYAAADPAVHAYSPMPYMLGLAGPDRLFVYQHGLQWATEEQPMPSNFIPSVHLLWGEAWLPNFERLTHPETDFKVVGSPWHDRLAQMAKERSVSTECDIVFLSASNSARSPSRAESYERLVTDVIEICQDHDFSLAIKLHPSEEGDWYRKRDLEQYVHEFDDIEDAILSTELLVTNNSSAFIECAVMETPVIVADLWEMGLERLGPLSKVYFTSDRETMEATIVEAVRSQAPDDGETNEIIPIGNSTDRIIELVARE